MSMSKDGPVVCLRCEQPMEPIDMKRRRCPRACNSGMCEPRDPPPYEFGQTFRQGASLHAGHCERADPSVWLDPETPCTCNVPLHPLAQPVSNIGHMTRGQQ